MDIVSDGDTAASMVVDIGAHNGVGAAGENTLTLYGVTGLTAADFFISA